MGDRPFAIGFGFGMIPVILSYLNGWIWFPEEFNWQHYTLITMCVLITFINYVNEYQQFFPLQYSKFAVEGGVPARLGWFTMYFSPVVFYLVMWSYLGAPNSTYDLLVMSVYCAHFGKRCFEVIFIHKYSKDCLLSSVFEISSLYCFSAVVTSYSCHGLVGEERFSFLDDELRVKVGLGVFVTGQFCNLLHHYLLANLRAPGSFKYVIPTGGLFSLVVCPQYCGELVSWLGFAITAYNFGGFLSYIPMVAYLCARAHHTYRWYGSKFDDYPAKGTLKIWPGVY